jgi:hypothetical protein
MAEWQIKRGDKTAWSARSLAEVREWFNDGRIVDADCVLHPVLQKWLYVRDLAELNDLRDGTARQSAVPGASTVRAPSPAPAPTAQPRVRTAEDSFLTRSRGCGDIILFGPLLAALVVLMVMAKACG